MDNSNITVAVLGASNKPDRYSNKAQLRLMEKGYTVFPVNPALDEIAGVKVFHSLSEIPVPVDTLTVYVGVFQIGSVIPDIVALKPRRVILNPGTESKLLKEALNEAGIPFLEACTLVMLSTGSFNA